MIRSTQETSGGSWALHRYVSVKTLERGRIAQTTLNLGYIDLDIVFMFKDLAHGYVDVKYLLGP